MRESNMLGSCGLAFCFACIVALLPLAHSQDIPQDAAQAKTTQLTLDERVMQAFRISETEVDQQEGFHVELRESIIGPWAPQVTSSMGIGGDEFGVHMPVWKLQDPAPADLCFAVQVKVVADGATFGCEPVVVARGAKKNGYFMLNDLRAFCRRYRGDVPVVLSLKPTKPLAPQHAHLTDVWQQSLESVPLRARVYYYPADKAPQVVRELRQMVSQLSGLAVDRSTEDQVHEALIKRGWERNAAYSVCSLASLNPYCRTMASSGLANAGEKAVPLLIKALEESDSPPFAPAQAAAQALTNLGTPAVAGLVEALQTGPRRLRPQLVLLLNNMATNERRAEMAPVVLPAILPLLADADPQLRQAVAHALHRFPDARAVNPLVSALSDAAAPVRASAAMALGWNKDPRASGALIAALQHDADDQVRQECATALGRIPGDAGLQPLIQAAASDDQAQVRREAVWALAYHEDTRAAAAMLKALDDPDTAVVVAAAYGLGQLKSERAVRPLIHALDSGENVRRAAARALAQITGQELGESPEAWEKWWQQQGARAEKEAAARQQRAPAPLAPAAPEAASARQASEAQARADFLMVEAIARLPSPEQRAQLPELYAALAGRYLNPVLEMILSSYRENILDPRVGAGPGEDHAASWARQLDEAAKTLTPEEVADKIGPRIWLDIATRVRCLALLKRHAELTESLISADLNSGNAQSLERACTAIVALHCSSLYDDLLDLFLKNSQPMDPVYRALVFLNDPSIVSALLLRVEQDPSFLPKCAGIFQGPLYGEPAQPLLLQLLSSADRELRYQAAWALLECRDARLADFIAQSAGDGEVRFRSAAAHMAARLPAESFDLIRAQLMPLLSDDDPNVREQALKSFAEQDDLAAADSVLRLLQEPQLAEQQKVTVIQAFGAMAGSTWQYDLHQWGPEPVRNRQAIDRFAAWLREARENTKAAAESADHSSAKMDAARHDIAWGPVVQGLQAGLRLKCVTRPVRIDRDLTVEFVIRNTTAKPISLLHPDVPVFINWANYRSPPGPQLLDADGKQVLPAGAVGGRGLPGSRVRAIKPQEMVQLAQVRIPLRAPDWQGTSVNVLAYSVEPGRYQLTLSYTLPAAREGLWNGTLDTGQLTVRVQQARSDSPATFCRLRTGSQRWSHWPVLLADLRNGTDQPLEQIWHGLEFDLEVDGKWIGTLQPSVVDGPVQHLMPGREWINVPLVLDDHYVMRGSPAESGRMADFAQLLPPGPHTLRVKVGDWTSNAVQIELGERGSVPR